MKDVVNQLIRERRTTYPLNFDPSRKIDNTLISEMLETAIWAPSHKLTQPWAFRVFHGSGIGEFFGMLMKIYREITPAEEIKESKLSKYQEKIGQVSHVVAVCMIRDPKERVPAIEEIVATACVIENIYICINAYGIAGYLSTGDICYTRQFLDFLRLGPEDHCLGFFQLGYPRADLKLPERKRISAMEKTIWIG